MCKFDARDVLDKVGPILMTALWAIKVVSSIEKKSSTHIGGADRYSTRPRRQEAISSVNGSNDDVLLSGDSRKIVGHVCALRVITCHITIAQWKRKFFANSSFLIFRTANRNGKALPDPKGAAYEA